MNHDVPSRARRREWIGLAVIALPCMLYSMDLTVLNLAVPYISADLRPSNAQMLWIVDIYGFVLAGMLIPMGTLGDRIGRRRLLLIGAAAFGGASILAAFARSAEMLIAARAVLGVAGATLAPSTLSLIRNMFHDPRERTRAIGVWISSYSVGGAIGPVLGGVIIAHFHWSAVFLLGVPAMLLLLVLGPFLLTEYRDERVGRIDIASAMMSLAAVLFVIFGVKRVAQGDGGITALASIVIGILVGMLFMRRQRKLAEPFIDLALFADRQFTIALAAYSLATFVAFGTFLFESQYLQLVRGMTSLQAGVRLVPLFLAFIAGSFATPALMKWMKPATVMSAGLVVAALGFLLMGRVSVTSDVSVFIAGCTVYCFGLSPVFTLATDQIVGAAPPGRAGVAAAISETSSELGGALGIAVLGSIGTAMYRMSMSMSNGVGQGMARATLGDAFAMAKEMPAARAEELRATAGAAFTHSVVVVAFVCAAMVIAMSVMIARVMRTEAA